MQIRWPAASSPCHPPLSERISLPFKGRDLYRQCSSVKKTRSVQTKQPCTPVIQATSHLGSLTTDHALKCVKESLFRTPGSLGRACCGCAFHGSQVFSLLLVRFTLGRTLPLTQNHTEFPVPPSLRSSRGAILLDTPTCVCSRASVGISA